MSGPVKMILIGVGAVLAIIVIAAIVIGMNLTEGVRRAIERYGPQFVGTGVHVDDVSLSLLDGEGVISGLRIDNPPGFDKPHALVLERLKLGVDLGSLGTDKLVLNELTIDSPVVYAEQSGGKSNLAILAENLEQAGGSTESSEEESAGSQVQVVVRHFAMRGARAVLSTRLAGEMTVELSDVELENVGEGGGLTLRQFLRDRLGPIAANVAKAAAQSGARQARELGGEATERARDLEQEATQKAQGLLDRFKRD
ncbi:MAG: hypothetical protein P8Y95_01150 [Gammaproteobacteria bacterium]